MYRLVVAVARTPPLGGSAIVIVGGVEDVYPKPRSVILIPVTAPVTVSIVATAVAVRVANGTVDVGGAAIVTAGAEV